LVNSLAQVLLKIASPGVPDFYQGTDLWDLTLVDPDNRRPVDFALRQRTLDAVDARLAQPPDARAAGIASLLQNWTDGAVKLLVTAAALRQRSTRPEVFLDGDYLPLDADMTVKGQVTAFARMSSTGGAAIAMAPHLVAPLIN